VKTLPAAVLSVAALTALAACTSPDTAPAPARPVRSVPASAPPASPDAARDTAALRRIADEANASDDDAMIAGGARLALGARREPLVSRDDTTENWDAGTYRLVVRCAGSGSVGARFRIGGAVATLALTCSPAGSMGITEVRVAQGAANSSVVITPDGSGQAAIAYTIQRV
jgi:hypothetical protein